MREEHNYTEMIYEYVRNTFHNMFTDNDVEQTIEDAIREYMRTDTVEVPVKKDLNDFKFFKG
jgi:hypothetical protein